MNSEPIKRYSQAFKQQVVREYEEGVSSYRLVQKYGIGDQKTVKRWVEQYGRSGYRSEMVVIQSREDQIEFKAMKERICELEAALAESVLETRMLAATLEVASRSLSMDLKKTFGKPSLSK